ncbi:UNVERIFIED_ORG: macrolide transport system ATP-binding/permease protein [Herbaspirillum seropedicae]|uniref:MacB family efflux pump subunit n=1 Tax=Herbaspirillum sp. 1130 TaxID=2806562 RepID=UPI000EB4117A|nr:MacB family efflux pump subunit [Herbaspirillum sp. 1130]MBP1312963.1 macrolide transport system ATP-binding/permease protein [Herbaspirillum sp. 1130]
MTTPLLQLRALRRDFPAGDDTITVLNDVNLDIAAGEMVAIVGASGSGKSTLMNILGCLDKPSAGSYLVAGRETGKLAPDELAQLRREHFGFIFQRYHLLSDLDATANVEVPAVYAGQEPAQRRQRAAQLLARLGLADRGHHKPGQLSGGQQQRVSIARALMNGGDVILADEPTGALDSHSGHEVMNILKELHAEGHTIIIVTHDMQVASNAQRIIEIKDGLIIADRRNNAPEAAAVRGIIKQERQQHRQASAWRAALDRFKEALRMSLLAMNAHRLRSFLTMLGIIIGIASVVSVVALGSGSREQILSDISSMGTNTIDIFPGTDFGDMKSAAIRTLTPADAAALAEQNYVDSVTPSVSTASSARYGNISVTATINGVGEQYFRVRGLKMAQGMSFDNDSIRRQAQEVVIDANTYKKLFPNGGNALGEVIFLGSVPCRVIGVTQKRENGFGNNSSLNVWVPYTTAMTRVIGQRYLSGITVRVSDKVPGAAAEQGITQLMTLRHRTKDFYIFNTDSIRQTIEKATATLTLLVSMIALISLVVGGIGVMNIMLVSVTERTREIGVRMAVGARQGDIMQQFLIEAVLVCLAGGLLGVLLALSFGAVFAHFVSSFHLIYSTASIVSAFACSTLIGVVFGFLPARNAARLNPVDALARE